MINRPRTITETLVGAQPVGKTYHVYYKQASGQNFEYYEIEEKVPTLDSGGGAYGHPANLKTARKYSDAKREKLTSVQHPDGTLDTYEYQDGLSILQLRPLVALRCSDRSTI